MKTQPLLYVVSGRWPRFRRRFFWPRWLSVHSEKSQSYFVCIISPPLFDTIESLYHILDHNFALLNRLKTPTPNMGIGTGADTALTNNTVASADTKYKSVITNDEEAEVCEKPPTTNLCVAHTTHHSSTEKILASMHLFIEAATSGSATAA